MERECLLNLVKLDLEFTLICILKCWMTHLSNKSTQFIDYSIHDYTRICKLNLIH